MICKRYIDYCESAVAQMPDKQRLIVEICNNYSRKNYHIAAQLILMWSWCRSYILDQEEKGMKCLLRQFYCEEQQDSGHKVEMPKE